MMVISIDAILALTLVVILSGALGNWLVVLYQEDFAQVAYPDKLPQNTHKKAIGLRYTIEILFLGFLVTYGGWAFILPRAGNFVIFWPIYVMFLVLFSYSDGQQRIIYDKPLLLFALVGLLSVVMQGLPWQEHLLGAVVGGLSFLLLAVVTKGGIGGGDVKLLAALGLWHGVHSLFLLSIVGIFLGGLWALVALVVRT